MPIVVTPFTHAPRFHGGAWTVSDENALAEAVARVAMGQSYHVGKILAGANLGAPPTTAGAAAGAIALLTPASADPSHRDGWIFQVMSWIAAHRAAPGGIFRAPQMILADKGFDGMQLEMDTTNNTVRAVVIFEDKATEHPRKTIRDEVWPSFVKLEMGERENVVVAEVISLLRAHSDIEPDAAIKTIIWNSVRRFRVSITVDDRHATPAGRDRLFKRYETVIQGAVERRRGETFRVPDLRNWMADIAARAIAAVTTSATANV